MNAGDLLVVHCWYRILPYSHFAIDMGDGTVIELASDRGRLKNGNPDLESMSVRRSSMEEFAGGRPVHVVYQENALPVDEVLARAESKLGTSAYCLVSGNCEHFARWCKTGMWVSEQVQDTQDTFSRAALHAAVLVSGRIGRLRSVTSHVTGIPSSARMAIPGLVGEITEQVAKCSLKRYHAAPHIVEQGSRLASYGTVAIVGLVLGGPTGSLTALAAHSLARRASRSTQ